MPLEKLSPKQWSECGQVQKKVVVFYKIQYLLQIIFKIVFLYKINICSKTAIVFIYMSSGMFKIVWQEKILQYVELSFMMQDV